MTDYFGSCLCATAKFQITGEFESFYLCHCKHCQKDTGSAHAANLFSASAQLTWLSGADAVTSFTLPGTRHSKSFCQLCGSSLPNAQAKGVLVVPAGCLDTQVSMVPMAHLFTASKADWDEGLHHLPSYKSLPE